MSEPRLPDKVRQAVALRAGGCCEYCLSQARYAPDPFSIEHIFPRAAGITDDSDNLALSCQGCNNRKYTSTSAPDPVTGEWVSLFHPRRQRWADHFAWSDDFSHVIGLTAAGRATVEKLQLNRKGVVNLRRVLREVGDHPPRGTER